MSSNLIQQLFTKHHRQVPRDQKQIEEIAQSLGSAHEAYPTIHVAGTNGKGSVATKIARTLERSGYRVGLYTSPHIQRFNERIQINGAEIPFREVERNLPSLLQRFPDLCFFDYATFLAFQYFKEMQVEIAVVEAGIGGFCDTTNVIHPLISIITSVALDHVEILGPTLDDIAYQKSGVIKPFIPIILGPTASLAPILKQAAINQSALIQVSSQEGDYDAENRAVARAALKELSRHFTIKQEALEKGLLDKPPCRFETCGRFVLDVAHNPAGFESLLKAWKLHYPTKKFHAIIGLSSDKDLKTCLQKIAKEAEHLFLVQAPTPRAASTDKLKGILEELRLSHFTCCKSISEAIALAHDHAILVCGTFHIMQQAREEILRLQIG